MDVAAVVCACCVAAGTWASGTARLSPEILSEIGRINLGADARVSYDAPGANTDRAPVPAQALTYRIRHLRPNRGWTIELRDAARGAAAGHFAFTIPDRGNVYASDVPLPDGRLQDGQLLYKEWRLSGPVKATGVAAFAGRNALTFDLVLQGWGTRCPDAAHFTRWLFRVRGRNLDMTLSGKLAAAEPRPGDASPLYFESPQAAVAAITALLRKEDWPTLARYYDLSGTTLARAHLSSGRFFLRTEPPPVVHPGLPWKFRHPFTPGFTFRETLTPAEAGVLIVVVGIEIDEGAGRIQRGTQEFSLRESARGYQLLPPPLERIR